MKKRVLILFSALLLVLILLSVSFYFFYLKKITIYEPISINFPGFASSNDKTIEVFSITPLDHKKNIQYSESDNCWWQNNGYHKAIDIVIPDSLMRKLDSIHILISNKKYNISIEDLKFVNSSDGKREYLLPSYIRSEDSLVKLLQFLFHLSIWKIFLILFLSFIVLLFVVFFIIKCKKIKSSWLSFLIVLEYYLKAKNISLQKVILWLKITVISVLIACILFFGFLLFAFCISTYFTSVLFILLSGLLLWVIIKIIFIFFKIPLSHIINVKKVLIIFLLIWFCIETFLRIIGMNSSHNELNGYYYSSGFNTIIQTEDRKTHLLVHPKYYSEKVKQNEFAYWIKCNKDGLRDIDRPLKREKNEYRIICLGNSFTEGIGAPQDSTWPKLLENKLVSLTKTKITVFNAGKSGSDPFYEYILFKEKLLNYKPTLLLLALGSSDFNFYSFKGGFERFTNDGCKYRTGPKWEKLYAVSYIFRYYINDILHYKNFMTQAEFTKDSIKAVMDIDSCIRRFYYLSKENGCKLVLVFYDDKSNAYSSIMKNYKQSKIIPVIDLFEYNKKIEKITSQNNATYYWPIDGHCNAKGYDMLARGVIWNLREMGIIDTLKTE